MKTVMLIMVGKRRETAVEVQKLLTEYGCSIKTRLGLHSAAGDQCTEDGLIILELAGLEKDHNELYEKLSALKCLNVKMEKMTINNCG
jgi:hypothetical protein